LCRSSDLARPDRGKKTVIEFVVKPWMNVDPARGPEARRRWRGINSPQCHYPATATARTA
jgi:hypothetical protein